MPTRHLRALPPPLPEAPGEDVRGDEHALVAGVCARDPAALSALHTRFAKPVLRILVRILGPERELDDLHHDVFVRALGALPTLREPAALPAFMRAIAVHTARAAIERRTRQRRFLFFVHDDVLPEPAGPDPAAYHDAREALRTAYRVLDQLPTDERMIFALRYFDAMELTEVAAATGVSLASVKRKLVRAEQRFSTLARQSLVLRVYLEGGTRWTED